MAQQTSTFLPISFFAVIPEQCDVPELVLRCTGAIMQAEITVNNGT